MSTEIICEAIAARTLLTFVHKGERYLVEPYSLDYESRDRQGNRPLLLRAWCDHGWRDFQVKFMSRLEVRDEPFVDVRLGHRSMPTVLCAVYGKRRSAN